MAFTCALVAHQGGWDEILLVAGPITVILGLLAIVKRRIDSRVGEGLANQKSPTEPSHGVGVDPLDESPDSA